MASSQSSSFPPPQAKYDVFLSFRGEDTRQNITSHIYDALCRKKILTFIDDRLKRGDEISEALKKTIEDSKISIIIFSKDYASSRWCLNELDKILECKENNGQVVIPVFYDISPSDVRKQTGSFKNAFVKHEKRFKKEPKQVQRWRDALTKASNLSGWDSMVTRPEAKLVNNVVEDVLEKLNDMSASDDFYKDLVGLNSRIEKIKSLLCIGLSDFQVVGIWGMGGIGKTTLAYALYDQLSSQFEGHYFCSNVREQSEKYGLVHILEQVLCGVLGEDIKISSTSIPKYTQQRLRRKKVFIVLDDVNTIEQLELLTVDQFNIGSRIIISTRDKQLLNSYGEHNIYEVERFNYDEALQLFCSYAFKRDLPLEDFVEYSNKVVDYAKGNPLALKVLGSSLCGNSKQEWESAMHNLKMICNPQLHDVLKISYEKLNSDEKNIFLDIACFFKGEDSDWVTTILDGCYKSVRFVLRALINKSLLIISDNKLQMHDLLQEMGREIVYQESETKPGERSRLWFHDDVYRVLRDNKGTDAIVSLFLDISRTREVQLSSSAFANMVNLRLLKVYKPWYFGEYEDVSKVLHLSRDLDYLPNELRYLHWDGYSSKTLPSQFSLENLVELQLPYSTIKQLWEGTKHASKLKFINLCFSKHLTDFPNLSHATKLESINLEGCKSLLDVSSSIQYLANLRILNLSGCASIKSFPSNIHFRSPIILNLSKCINFTEFPLISGNVTELNLTRTGIEEVPPSIACLSELVDLNMSDCNMLKNLSTGICKLRSLCRLNLSDCLRLESFPEILEKMENLKVLDLRRTAIKELPSSIEHLNGLEELILEKCKNLEKIPNSICNMTSLRDITLNDCPKLDRLPENLGNLISLENFCASRSLVHQLPSGMACWKEIRELRVASCNLTKIPEDLCCLFSLERLDLSENNFESLPTSINQLSQLRWLQLRNCKMLQSIPQLPLALKYLDARNCKQLQSLPVPPCLQQLDQSELEAVSKCYSPVSDWTIKFLFTNCLELNQRARNNVLADSQQRIQNMIATALRLCYEKVFDEIPKISLCFPGSEIPSWFSHQCSGSSITIQLPHCWYYIRLIGFALSAVIEFGKSDHEQMIEVKCNYNFQTNLDWDHFDWDCAVKLENESIESDHVVLGYIPCMVKHDLKLSFDFKPFKTSVLSSFFKLRGRPLEGCKIKSCGIHPLYLQPKINQPHTSLERFAATDEGLVETNLVDSPSTSGNGNGRCNDEAVESHADTDCSLRGSVLKLLSCWTFVVNFFRQT